MNICPEGRQESCRGQLREVRTVDIQKMGRKSLNDNEH